MKSLTSALLFIMMMSLIPGWSYADEYDQEEIIYQMEPLIVIDTRLPSHPQDSPFDVAIIPGEEIADNQDLADVVGDETGIDLRRYGGAGTVGSLAVRGSSANQVLVLYDRIPINSAYGGEVGLNTIILVGIRQVELLRGPASALYGANALGGVINLVNLPLDIYGDGLPHGTFSTTLGSDNHYSTTANVKWFGEYLSLNGAFTTQHDDGFRENSDLEKMGGSFRIDFHLPGDGRIFAATTKGSGELGVIGPLSMEDATARQWDWSQMFYGGASLPLWSDAQADVTVYRRQSERLYKSDMWMTESDHQLTTSGAIADFHISLPYYQQVLLSGEFCDDYLISTDIGEQRGRNYALLIQDLFKYGPLELVGGVRYDKHKQWGGEVSPRIGARYALAEWLSLRGAYARGFRAPTMTELYWPVDPYFGGGGNPNLIPEHSWALEAGVELHPLTTVGVSMTAYYQRYEDLISGWPPENIAEARSLGGELSTWWEMGYGLSFEGSYSYNHMTGREMTSREGAWLDYHPRHLIRAGMEWTGNLLRGLRLTTELGMDYTSAQNATYFDMSSFQYVTTELPANTLLSAKLRVDFSPFFGELRVENLTNQQYQQVYDYPMPGRQFYISGGFKF